MLFFIENICIQSFSKRFRNNQTHPSKFKTLTDLLQGDRASYIVEMLLLFAAVSCLFINARVMAEMAL